MRGFVIHLKGYCQLLPNKRVSSVWMAGLVYQCTIAPLNHCEPALRYCSIIPLFSRVTPVPRFQNKLHAICLMQRSLPFHFGFTSPTNLLHTLHLEMPPEHFRLVKKCMQIYTRVIFRHLTTSNKSSEWKSNRSAVIARRFRRKQVVVFFIFPFFQAWMASETMNDLYVKHAYREDMHSATLICFTTRSLCESTQERDYQVYTRSRSVQLIF